MASGQKILRMIRRLRVPKADRLLLCNFSTLRSEQKHRQNTGLVQLDLSFDSVLRRLPYSRHARKSVSCFFEPTFNILLHTTIYTQKASKICKLICTTKILFVKLHWGW